LQELELLACWQPEAGRHESVVHTLPSSQLTVVPAQAPPEQTSLPVQAFPSLHTTALLVCAQPLAGVQPSVVQTLLSLQSSAGPPTQAPPAQVSLVVQALPSLHGLELLTCRQPSAESQESSVQRLPSSQSGGGPPTQAPSTQVSLVVQALPSLQAATLFTCTQPDRGLQESFVQPLPSLQLGGGPPRQDPPEHVSPVVHGFPSSHGLALLVCVQPVAELHPSLVQALPSLQSGGGPPRQAPPTQTSPVVHAFPSLHDDVLLVNTQTPAGHESVVQTLLSLHSLLWLHSMQPPIGVPWHVPPAQTSPLVQA
jgi:hypothetical protein